MHDIFYFTDVHGMYDLYKAAIDYCLEQDPECMILYGGDACDRGPDGYKIMKELLTHPQVNYLKGNHEDMFVCAAQAIQKDYKGSFDEQHISDYLYYSQLSESGEYSIKNHLYNGGYQLLHDWMLDGMPQDFVEKINNLPITFSYGNMDFCHAGGRYKEFLSAQSAEYENVRVSEDDQLMLLWDRNYLSQGWRQNRICIFGHTPVTYLAAKYYGKDKSLAAMKPCSYIGQLDDKWTGKKIDMDTGAFVSGKLYVLNCLTLKAQGIIDKDINNEKVNKHTIEKIEVIQL